jgi:AraC family transcriptional regulator
VDRKFEQCLDHIRANFREDLHLEELAAIANLSPFHFHRLFKKTYHETPAEYLRRIRLEYASHILGLYPERTILEVALECGFNSLVAFSRAFRSYYNLSPTAFRRIPLSYNKLSVFSGIPDNLTEPLEVNTCYMEEQLILCRLTTLSAENIQEQFLQIQDEASALKITTQPVQWTGIYIDTPIHTSLTKCRYYAGVKVNDSEFPKKQSFIYTIPSGRFAYFTFTGDAVDLSRALRQFQFQWLNKSSFKIKDPIGYEQIKYRENTPFDKLERVLYIPVQPTN